tara:strand:+ start:1846 stop:2412 length:567 start_codon:yes stop_codon:yes gene_type:complete
MILKRNIALMLISLIYVGLNMSLHSMLFDTKIKKIAGLEVKQKSVNETYITAQILSRSLDKVYTIFENNLASAKNSEINKEASMVFLKDLTDIIEKHDIKLDQILPGRKVKKGLISKVPYQLQFKCDYEKLGHFIVELENNNRIILIDELVINNDVDKAKRNNDDKSILDLNIEMKIFTTSINKAVQL